MMRGRKRKPDHLAVVDAGFRPAKPPTCPAHLNATARTEWKRLAQHLFARGIITEGDRAALAAYCQSYGRWVEAERKLAETPMLIKLPSGYIQQSPWLAIANKQLEIMAKYMAELGLSPVSRGRVSSKRPLGPRPWDGANLYGSPRASDAYLNPR